MIKFNKQHIKRFMNWYMDASELSYRVVARGNKEYIKSIAKRPKFKDLHLNRKIREMEELYDRVEAIASAIFRLAYYYTPVKTGKLRSRLEIKRINAGHYKVFYNMDDNDVYQIYVHEKLENYHERPTRAKFLEDAAVEIINKYVLTDEYSREMINVNFGFEPLGVDVYMEMFVRGTDRLNNTVPLYKADNEFVSFRKDVKDRLDYIEAKEEAKRRAKEEADDVDWEDDEDEEYSDDEAAANLIALMATGGLDTYGTI
jgi:hypothetical protein